VLNLRALARRRLDGADQVQHAFGVAVAEIVEAMRRAGPFDLDRVKSLLKRPLMVDLRNIYRPAQTAESGFTYVSVGRKTVGRISPISKTKIAKIFSETWSAARRTLGVCCGAWMNHWRRNLLARSSMKMAMSIFRRAASRTFGSAASPRRPIVDGPLR